MTIGASNAEEAATLDARISGRGHVVSVGLCNVPTTHAISAISQSGSVASVTAVGHGCSVDDAVQIAGVTPSGYNGHWRVVSVSDADHLVINVPTGLGTASGFGTIGKHVEISGGSYARVDTASNDWNNAVGGSPTVKTGPKAGGSSGGAWVFPQATAQWADSTHPIVSWVLHDNTDNVNFWRGLMTSPQPVNNLDTVQFDVANQITIQSGDSQDPF